MALCNVGMEGRREERKEGMGGRFLVMIGQEEIKEETGGHSIKL